MAKDGYVMADLALMDARSIFLVCLAARIVMALTLRTAFAPDEYWQGPEVAHRMIFG